MRGRVRARAILRFKDKKCTFPAVLPDIKSNKLPSRWPKSTHAHSAVLAAGEQGMEQGAHVTHGMAEAEPPPPAKRARLAPAPAPRPDRILVPQEQEQEQEQQQPARAHEGFRVTAAEFDGLQTLVEMAEHEPGAVRFSVNVSESDLRGAIELLRDAAAPAPAAPPPAPHSARNGTH